MRNGLTAQQASRNALGRAASVAMAGFMALALAACTTVEGGNALTDIGTFEREVMTSTARGVGLIPGEAPKDDLTTARAPLVLPTSGQALPAPTTQAASAQLPANSDTVRIDTANLSEADLTRLRNAKVVDLNSVAGRPLTEEEARTLTARMQKNNLDVSVANSERPLYLPPADYFTRVGDAELVCSIGNGQVVSLSDARCPEEVRKAIQDARRRSTGPLSSGTAISNSQGVGLTKSETGQD